MNNLTDILNTLDLGAAYEGIYRQNLWAASHI